MEQHGYENEPSRSPLKARSRIAKLFSFSAEQSHSSTGAEWVFSALQLKACDEVCNFLHTLTCTCTCFHDPGNKEEDPECFYFEVFWLKSMACTECRNFSGSPVCGACRAAKRVLNIIQSGRLPRSEDRRVTGLVRGLAGELSDLLEAHLSVESKVPPSEREDKGEIKAPTTGAFVAEKVKKEEQSESEYTCTEEEKDVEVGKDQEESKEEPPAPPPAAKEGKTKAEEPEKEKAAPKPKSPPQVEKANERESQGCARLNPNFQRDYLTRRIGLHPCPKPGARSSSSTRAAPVNASSPDNRSSAAAPRRDHGGSVKRERSREREPGESRPISPDRPPLQRRPPQPKEGKKRKKKNNPNRSKGVKRRERGRNFRARRQEDQQRRPGRW